MTPAQLEELDALERAATKGPWILGKNEYTENCCWIYVDDDELDDMEYYGVLSLQGGPFAPGILFRDNDSELTVALRNHARELIDNSIHLDNCRTICGAENLGIEIVRARDMIQHLKHQLKKARELLRDCQFKGMRVDTNGLNACPVCKAYKPDHAASCPLAAFLEETKDI